MKYTPEQHLQTARAQEGSAKTEADPNRKALLTKSANLHLLAARAGRSQQAKKQTAEALNRAQEAAHATRSTPPSMKN